MTQAPQYPPPSQRPEEPPAPPEYPPPTPTYPPQQQYPTAAPPPSPNPPQQQYPTVAPPPSPGQYVPTPYPYAPAPVVPGVGNGWGLSGMILGILALLFVWFPFVNVAWAIWATALGSIGYAKVRKGAATNRGQAIAGLVMGIVALVGSAVVMVLLGTSD